MKYLSLLLLSADCCLLYKLQNKGYLSTSKILKLLDFQYCDMTYQMSLNYKHGLSWLRRTVVIKYMVVSESELF